MGVDKQAGTEEGVDTSYNPPKGFYAAYVKWHEDSLKGMLSVITIEKSRQHLMSFHQPESEADILKRLRSLPAKKLDSSISTRGTQRGFPESMPMWLDSWLSIFKTFQ